MVIDVRLAVCSIIDSLRSMKMHMLSRRWVSLILCLLFVSFFALDVSFYLSSSTTLTGRILRTFTACEKRPPGPRPEDFCFDAFLRLFAGHNMSGDITFFEPQPPIPVTAIPLPCGHFLVPKPLSPGRLRELRRCFPTSPVTSNRRVRIRRGLRIVKRLFEKVKVPLIMCCGSLIGSHRYHGMIPYDDDFDFFIPAENRSFIKRRLTELCEMDRSFYCLPDVLKHLQLFIGIENPDKRDYASFIDFFSFNKSNVVQKDAIESTIFPLVKRPLEGDLYDSLSNYPLYMKRVYGDRSKDTCESFDHDHWPRVKGCESVLCRELDSFLPFVVVSQTPRGLLEIGVNASFVHSLFLRRNTT